MRCSWLAISVSKPTTATLVRLNGTRDTIKQFADAPTFLQWRADGLYYLRHDRLWHADFAEHVVRGPAHALGSDAALYSSASNEGSILYISEDGLRLRDKTGKVRQIGWPITFTSPVAASLLIRTRASSTVTADRYAAERHPDRARSHHALKLADRSLRRPIPSMQMASS
jgi:hypothetical protein